MEGRDLPGITPQPLIKPWVNPFGVGSFGHRQAAADPVQSEGVKPVSGYFQWRKNSFCKKPLYPFKHPKEPLCMSEFAQVQSQNARKGVQCTFLSKAYGRYVPAYCGLGRVEKCQSSYIPSCSDMDDIPWQEAVGASGGSNFCASVKDDLCKSQAVNPDQKSIDECARWCKGRWDCSAIVWWKSGNPSGGGKHCWWAVGREQSYGLWGLGTGFRRRFQTSVYCPHVRLHRVCVLSDAHRSSNVIRVLSDLRSPVGSLDSVTVVGCGGEPMSQECV